MPPAPSSNVRFVLVEPSHPGNVGAVARAMKTMGLQDLALVNPHRYPSAEATARAAGADDILYAARTCTSLSEACADCNWVVGTSARDRRIGWPVMEPREFAVQAVSRSATGRVAVVFGRERSGLSNRELDRCQALLRIPANPEFNSLNIASAVQLVSYELRLEGARRRPGRPQDEPHADRDPPVTAAELDGFFSHLETVLVEIGYLDPGAPKLLMRRLRRLFGRCGILRSELNILRGILSATRRAAAGSEASRRSGD